MGEKKSLLKNGDLVLHPTRAEGWGKCTCHYINGLFRIDMRRLDLQRGIEDHRLSAYGYLEGPH